MRRAYIVGVLFLSVLACALSLPRVAWACGSNGDCNDNNPCTVDTCPGGSGERTCSNTAGNGGTTCRAAAGACDLAEQCTGTSTTCPADAKSTALCRASAGVCDPAEFCPGNSNNCPADAKSTAVCRPSAGDCDAAESCDGVNNDCPADQFTAAGVTCRAASAGQACDEAESLHGRQRGLSGGRREARRDRVPRFERRL